MPIRRAWARLRAHFGGHHDADADLRAELEAHVEMETEANIRRGLPPDEARRQALASSGGLTQAMESVRATRGLPWLESLAADLRYALRHFRRTPLSTVTMVLVLSLGIGTNVVLFTVFNSIATAPAPGIARDASLVRIRGTMRLEGMAEPQARLLSWPEVQEYAVRTDLFAAVAAYADESGLLTTGDASAAPVPVRLMYATPNYLRLLGVRPALGTEPPAEANVARLTTSPAAMISHALWQQRLGGAPDVVGRTIRVNDIPVEIVGVAPPRFVGADGGGSLAMWVPLAAYPLLQRRSSAVFASDDSVFLSAAARLNPGFSTAAVTPIVAGLAARAGRPGQGSATTLATRVSDSLASRVAPSADVVPMLASNARVGGRSDLLVSAATSAGFALLVLLITCTNVSALMVGLAVARRREIGVRLSLGAPRARLIRQLLTESVLLALIAAAVGLVVTTFGIRFMGTALEGIPLAVDWRVTLGTCAVAIGAGLLFGVSPALHATRVSVGEVLKNSAAALAATRSRLQRVLVVAQIALTQPLLVGLGVVVAALVTDMRGATPPGVAERVVEIELDTWAGRVSNAERASRMQAVVERVAAMPGVVAAAPMQMGTIGAPLTVHTADRVPGVTYAPAMPANLVAAPRGYFDAVGVPVVRGRDFAGAEYDDPYGDPTRAPSYDVVIIASDLARRLWGDADPIGRRLTLALSAPSKPMVVVGVVDAVAAGPSEAGGQTRVFVPYASLYTGVIARTAGPALPMLNTLRAVVAADAPQMPIVRVQTVAQREAEFRRDVLRASGAAAGGGLLALLLSAIGLYAVVSFVVGQRTREIGIRTALGAPRGRVVGMFFGRGMVLSAVGIVLGVPLSVVVTRVVAGVLHWPVGSAPVVGVAIAGVVLVVAAVAVWVPARRASGVEAVVALRAE